MASLVESLEAVRTVVNDAYKDGVLVATQHGFEEVYRLQRTPDLNHYYLINGLSSKHLTDRDLGQYTTHIIQFSRFDDLEKGDVLENLELMDTSGPMIIEKGVLLRNQKDLVGVMFGTVTAIGPTDRGFYPAYYMRLGINFRNRNDDWKEDRVVSLAEAVRNIRPVREGLVVKPFAAEIAGLFGDRIEVTAPGAGLVPGMTTTFLDHGWLLKSGRAALKAVIDDVFVMRERFYHLQSFGTQESVDQNL